jgi:hypothetical protein
MSPPVNQIDGWGSSRLTSGEPKSRKEKLAMIVLKLWASQPDIAIEHVEISLQHGALRRRSLRVRSVRGRPALFRPAPADCVVNQPSTDRHGG